MTVSPGPKELSSPHYRAFRRTKIMLASLILLLQGCVSCEYIKQDPPPDVDKYFHDHKGKPTCWIATAANMLAGAGYCAGYSSMQDCADAIYLDIAKSRCFDPNFLPNEYKPPDTVPLKDWKCFEGHTASGLRTWLENNAIATNPYRMVTVYGHLGQSTPWHFSDVPKKTGNHLRQCDFVALSLAWPGGGTGHAITAWGDTSEDTPSITSNPKAIKVTDSDWETNGDLQKYAYTDTGGAVLGSMTMPPIWTINHPHDPNASPWIRNIVVLSKVMPGAPTLVPVRVVESYRIHQSNSAAPADDLHYVVGNNVGKPIVWESSSIDWEGASAPSVDSSANKSKLTVDWDFDQPVEYCNWVTVTAELALEEPHAVFFGNVQWTFDGLSSADAAPEIEWTMESPKVPSPESIPNITGGYVVASFELAGLDSARRPWRAEFRLVAEYPHSRSPEHHTFTVKGSAKQVKITKVQFGHSYGYLDPESLWEFDNWMPTPTITVPLDLEGTNTFDLDWSGQLPYPTGENYIRKTDPSRGLIVRP